jgi:hypothetical protein
MLKIHLEQGRKKQHHRSRNPHSFNHALLLQLTYIRQLQVYHSGLNSPNYSTILDNYRVWLAAAKRDFELCLHVMAILLAVDIMMPSSTTLSTAGQLADLRGDYDRSKLDAGFRGPEVLERFPVLCLGKDIS